MSDSEPYKGLKDEFPANSKKSKVDPVPDKKKLESVVSAPVVTRKKPLGRRIFDTFKGDDINTVGGYLLFEVILPASKAMISDAVREGVDRMLFGNTYRGPMASSTRSTSGVGFTSYNRMASSTTRPDIDRPGGKNVMSSAARAQHNFDEVILRSRGEAEMVLVRLQETIDSYGQATVADLYDLIEVTGEYTDEKWGWDRDSFVGYSVRPVRGGYLIVLPPTKPIV